MRFIKLISSFLLSLVLLFSVIVPAPATILFGGGEDLDFSLIGGAGIVTTAGTFRSAYARSAVNACASGCVVSDPSTPRMVTPTFTNQTIIWVHAENFSPGLGTASGMQAAGIYGSDGVRRLLIRGTGSNGTVKISTRNTAGTITDLVTCTSGAFPINNILTKVDWYVNYAVAGQTTLYINGINVCNYTGDITTNSVTAVNQADFGQFAISTNNYWSEVIVATTDTRDMNLFTCAPQANGTTQNWTGTASSVNPITIADTAAITTGSTNVIGNFTCPSLPAGAFTVPAVVQSARVQGTGSITNFRFSARPAGSGADFDTSADIPIITTFQNSVNNIVTLDPNSSTAWTTTTLGSGVNFGIKSRP